MTTVDDLLHAGLTYRQIDHWTAKGYLRTEGESRPGTGRARRWKRGEAYVAELMARLVAVGLAVPVAERVARGEREIGPGVLVVIGDVVTADDDSVMDDLCEILGWEKD